jgi:hypothetical protein
LFHLFSVIDAAGKPPSNILGGGRMWLGDFDECDLQVYTKSCEFEPRSWRGVLDTLICDKVYQ